VVDIVTTVYNNAALEHMLATLRLTRMELCMSSRHKLI